MESVNDLNFLNVDEDTLVIPPIEMKPMTLMQLKEADYRRQFHSDSDNEDHPFSEDRPHVSTEEEETETNVPTGAHPMVSG